MRFCLSGEFSSRQITQETEVLCFSPQLSSTSYLLDFCLSGELISFGGEYIPALPLVSPANN